MPYHYHAFGLTMGCNIPIADLVPAISPGHCDLEIRLGIWPEWMKSLKESSLRLATADINAQTDFRKYHYADGPDGGVYHLYTYPDGCQFLVNQAGAEIWARWPDGYLVEDVIPYLLGPAFGLMAFLRGKLSLHASAFLHEGGAVLFLGPGGAGKSSTLGGMVQRGFKAVTEDLSLLDEQDGRFLVQPGYPRIRLWPAGVKTVLGPDADAPRLTPTWDKCYLPVEDRFCPQQVPVKRVYVLGKRTDREHLEAPQPLTQHDAFLALLANVYFPIPHAAAHLSRHLKSLTQMAGSGMVFLVAAQNDPRRLGDFLDLVLEHCAVNQQPGRALP